MSVYRLVIVVWSLVYSLDCMAVDGLATPAAAESNSLLSQAVRAQSSWDSLQTVQAGTKCRIYLRSDKTVSGMFQEWTPERLVLSSSKGKLVECLRNDISSVALRTPANRKKKALWGSLIGFGIGFPIGYALAPQIADVNSMPGGERAGDAAGVGAIFAGIGAGLSLLGGEDETIIYRAK
jgi:hypothetical protein